MVRRLSVIATVIAAVLAVALLPAPALAESRIALVIGNSNYESVGRLRNPAQDAAAIAETLKALGFETTLVQDQDRDGLSNSLRAFGRKANGVDIAAIYYAGHGMEADGQNYLIPVDAKLETDQDIDYELVPLELVLRSVSGAKSLRLVMLDACRNNPFLAQMTNSGASRSVGRGFARIEPANNTLIAYAAKAGTTADDGESGHSPFASALLENLSAPGQEVRLVFGKVRDDVLAATGNRQEPFVYGSMGGQPIYLAAAEAAPPEAPQVDPKAIDLSFWNSIQGSNDPALFEAYLKQFPEGSFAVLARARLQQLETAKLEAAQKEQQVAALTPEAPPSPGPAQPEAESLDATYVAKQTANVRAEPNAGAKLMTKLARDDGVTVTGRVKGENWLRVQLDGMIGYVNTGSLIPIDSSELADWKALQTTPTFEAAQTYLQKYPEGYFVDRVSALAGKLAPPPPEPEITDMNGSYVAIQSANVRKAPSTDAQVVGQLQEDESIAVTGRLQDGKWYRVDRDGQAAFVSATLLQQVDDNEMRAWRQVTAAPSIEAVETFLEQYPNAHFKAKAEVMKASLKKPEPDPAAPATAPLPAEPGSPPEAKPQTIAALQPAPAPSATEAPAPQPAAVVPPAPADGRKEIRVGDVYLLQGILRLERGNMLNTPKSRAVKGEITIIDSQGGAFAGKAQSLGIDGDIKSIELTQDGSDIKIRFDTTVGPGIFSMTYVNPGEFSGDGTVVLDTSYARARYSGPATLTLVQPGT